MNKRKQYIPILFLAACMLAMTLSVWVKGMDMPPMDLLYVHDRVTGGWIEPFYEEEEDTYYLYFPSYSSSQTVKLSLRAPALVSITDEAGNRYGTKITELPQGQTLSMTIRSLLYSQTVKLKAYYTTGISSLYVKGEDGFLDVVQEDKRNEVQVTASMADAQGQHLFTRVSILNGRGNGTWDGMAKRPYNLAFDNGITVGPFQNIEKLCLLAEYSDESKMRNSVAYFAGQELDIPYASAYMYTNLYINGEYQGLYGIVTKQEYKKHLSADGIKAVFELASDGYSVSYYVGDKPISVMYGDEDYVWEIVQDMEESISQRDWETAFQRIDLQSFAKKYALDEFLGNMDLGYASQYYYVDENDVVHCMLPWDYDWTIGNAILFYHNRPVTDIKAYIHQNYWSTVLIENEQFRQAVVDALETDFTDAFIGKLENHLAETSAAIAPSWEADRERWEHEIPYTDFHIASGIQTTEGFRQMFCSYFPERKAFMLDYFSRIEDFCTVRFEGMQWCNFNIPRGEPLAPYLEGANILNAHLPGSSSTFLGYWSEDGRQPQDVEIVTEDITFISRFDE